MKCYVVAVGSSQETEGEIDGVFSDKYKALERWKGQRHYSCVYECVVDGSFELLKIVPTAWQLSKHGHPVGPLSITNKPEEFLKLATEYLISLNDEALALKITSYGPTYWSATVWRNGPFTDANTVYLNGKADHSISLAACDWDYETRPPVAQVPAAAT